MRHFKSGRKLGRTASHRTALLKNMATELFEHKRIHTTLAKAKELRPYAETLITKAKSALSKEQTGQIPDGSKIDLHSRRVVARHIQKKTVLQELFDSIAPVVAERNGGYIRIVKTGLRRGDASETAIIELVDWNTSEVSKPKKKAAKKPKAAKPAEAAPVAAAPLAEEAASAAEGTADPVIAEVAAEAEVAADAAGGDTAVETPADDNAPAEGEAEEENKA